MTGENEKNKIYLLQLILIPLIIDKFLMSFTFEPSNINLPPTLVRLLKSVKFEELKSANSSKDIY